MKSANLQATSASENTLFRNAGTQTPQTIGDRIRRQRKRMGLTQQQLSASIGISTSYLGAIERGARRLSGRMLILLHQKMNVSYEYLLEGITLSGTPVPQYVRESSPYGSRRNLDVLLGTCSPAELEVCSEMIHSYLTHSRQKKVRQQDGSPSSPAGAEEDQMIKRLHDTRSLPAAEAALFFHPTGSAPDRPSSR